MKRSAAMVVVAIMGLGITACVPAKQAKVESPEAVEAEPTAAVGSNEEQRVSTKTSRDTKPAADAEAPAEPTPKLAEKEATAPAPAPRKKIDLIEMLTAQGTAFIIDYHNSGALEAADAACTEKANRVEQSAKADQAAKATKAGKQAKPATEAGGSEGTKAPDKDDEDDDAEAAEAAAIAEKVEAARKECLKQARDKFAADILRFRRDGLGHTKLVISKRNGSAVKELYVANVELKALSDQAVKVEVKEAGIGQRPIMKDRRDFEISIPNSYGIELKDTVFGRLPYDAKVGLVAN